MESRGIIYIAYGDKAISEFIKSSETMRQVCNHPIVVISDKNVAGQKTIVFDSEPTGRWAKLNADCLSPFDLTLYLDADTRVRQPIDAGFEMIADGWDLAITPSQQQGPELLWHVGEDDKEYTLDTLGFDALQLQGGLFFFRKSRKVKRFFTRWRIEWLKYKNQDQGALLRALYANPAKVWLLGHCWNGGAIVEHTFAPF